MEGMWQFDSLGPPILYFFINQDPDMQASVRAMTTDPLGRPVLFFDFDTLNQTMRAMLNRRTYGDAAVEEAIDSILYVIHTTIEYDSVWHIAGALSGDTVDVSIDSAGNMTYTHVTDTVAPHTYYLHPQAAQCPTNSLAPVWWEPNFLQLNQRP